MVQKHKRKGFFLKLTAAALAAGFICFCLMINFVFPVRYSALVLTEAENFDVEPQLIYAVIWTESKFDKNAVSNAGAMGLMQLMPSTAAFCAKMLSIEYSEEKLFDAAYNIKLGTFYLSYLINKFSENGKDTAIAAYNAGEGNVIKWLNDGGEIKFKETDDYVKRVNLAKSIYKIKA